MKLREAPFQAIKEGRKDIELRLYDEKRKAINKVKEMFGSDLVKVE